MLAADAYYWASMLVAGTLGTVAGVALGDFTAMTASMVGLGALLSASADVFTVLKWIGALSRLSRGLRWCKPLANPPRHKTSHELGLRAVCDRYS